MIHKHKPQRVTEWFCRPFGVWYHQFYKKETLFTDFDGSEVFVERTVAVEDFEVSGFDSHRVG